MMIFNVKTTGVDYKNCQICQLSYIKINGELEVEYAKNFYFSVHNMSSDAQYVHELTVEMLEGLSDGKSFRDFADEIYNDFISVKKLVGHNAEPDFRFLLAELDRLGYDVQKLKRVETFCTMHQYTRKLQLKYSTRHNRYISLSLLDVMRYLGISTEDVQEKVFELYPYAKEVSLHGSRFDVTATMMVFILFKKVNRYMEYKEIVRQIECAQDCLNEIKYYFQFDEEMCSKKGIDRESNCRYVEGYRDILTLSYKDLDYIDNEYYKMSNNDNFLARRISAINRAVEFIGNIEHRMYYDDCEESNRSDGDKFDEDTERLKGILENDEIPF